MIILRNSVLISFTILLFIGYVVSLTCFSCEDCGDPFDVNSNDTITVENGTQLFCKKTKGAGIIDRNITDGCSPFTAVGNGVWCCATDLCNSANPNQISLLPLFAVILVFSLFS